MNSLSSLKIMFHKDILLEIYQYIPCIYKKLCNYESNQIYKQLYLPESSIDWNLNCLHKNHSFQERIVRFTTYDNLRMIIHNIYTEIVRFDLHNIFTGFEYTNNQLVKQSEVIRSVIFEHCFDYRLQLGFHYKIIEGCLLDILNGKNYYKWLKAPEEKFLNF